MKLHISHEQFEKDALLLAKKIQKKYDSITIITRWWLILGYYLARELWIKEIYTLWLESYSGDSQWSLRTTNDYIHHENTLFVDDLVDTGETLKYCKELWGHCAVLYRKPNTTVEPDYHGRDMPDEWIDFYYETD